MVLYFTKSYLKNWIKYVTEEKMIVLLGDKNIPND